MRSFSLIALILLAPLMAAAEDSSLNKQLIEACYSLNQYRVVKFLRLGADVDARLAVTPIARRGELTPLLALANSLVDQADDEAKRRANNRRRITILRILLSHGCDIDAEDESGSKAIDIAIHRQDADFVKLLLLFQPKGSVNLDDPILDFLRTHDRLPTPEERQKIFGDSFGGSTVIGEWPQVQSPDEFILPLPKR